MWFGGLVVCWFVAVAWRVVFDAIGWFVFVAFLVFLLCQFHIPSSSDMAVTALHKSVGTKLESTR